MAIDVCESLNKALEPIHSISLKNGHVHLTAASLVFCTWMKSPCNSQSSPLLFCLPNHRGHPPLRSLSAGNWLRSRRDLCTSVHLYDMTHIDRLWLGFTGRWMRERREFASTPALGAEVPKAVSGLMLEQV